MKASVMSAKAGVKGAKGAKACAKSVKGAKGSMKGSKGANGCKGNPKVGFWVPTTCEHKKFDYNI